MENNFAPYLRGKDIALLISFHEARMADVTHRDISTHLKAALTSKCAEEAKAAGKDPNAYSSSPWMVDVAGDQNAGHVVHEQDGKLFKRSYTMTAAKGKRDITIGPPVAVVPRTTYDDMGTGAPMAEAHKAAIQDAVARASTSSVTITTVDGATLAENAIVHPTVTDPTVNQRLTVQFEGVELTEAAATAVQTEKEYVKLAESSVGVDGTMKMKIIAPGWGSSGYYPPEVLKRDGPNVFKSGTKMYWNHATAVEESQRPEGDLDKFAAVLKTSAAWDDNGSAGPGLYALATVNKEYREAVDDLAPHIGVSIRASGLAKQGKAAGRSGPIIQQIEEAKSVDFVTEPGAGGRILQLFESKRGTQPLEEGANNMDEKEIKALQESNAALAGTNQKILQRLALSDARDLAGKMLEAVRINPAVKARILESVILKAPINKDNELDAAAFKPIVEAEIKSETEYVAKITESGRVTGMGGAPVINPETDPAKLTESLNGNLKAIFG